MFIAGTGFLELSTVPTLHYGSVTLSVRDDLSQRVIRIHLEHQCDMHSTELVMQSTMRECNQQNRMLNSLKNNKA